MYLLLHVYSCQHTYDARPHTRPHTRTQTVHHQRHHGEAQASDIESLKRQIDHRDQFLERAGLHIPTDEADEEEQLRKRPGNDQTSSPLPLHCLVSFNRITGTDRFGFIELLDVLVLFFDSFPVFFFGSSFLSQVKMILFRSQIVHSAH